MPGLLDPRLATGTRVDDETARRYLENGEWTGSPLGSLLRAAAAEHPERTAVVTRADGRTSMRYRELVQTVDDVRTGLSRLGVSDRETSSR